VIVWWLDLQLHVYKDENKLGTVEGVIVWWLDLQLHVYKDENKLGAVEVVIVWWLDLQLCVFKDENKLGNGRDRMVVRFTTTCVKRREQVRGR
jgi:hypothetical protein